MVVESGARRCPAIIRVELTPAQRDELRARARAADPCERDRLEMVRLAPPARQCRLSRLRWRVRRGVGHALTPLPSGAILIAAPPPRQQAGQSGRSGYQRPRPRRLSSSEREAVLALAPNCTLRELAAEFGVSHETIRTVCRSSGPFG